MNILIVTPFNPYPKDRDGFSLSLGNLIDNWSKEHNVVLYNYERMKNNNSNMFEKSYRIFICPRNSINYDFRDIDVEEDINYDLVILARFESVFFIDKLDKVKYKKIVFFELDLLSLLYLRMAKREKNIIKKFYNYYQYKLIENVEKKYSKFFDKIVFVSEIDKNYAIKKFSNINSEKFINIRNGVEEVLKKSVIKMFKTKERVKIAFSGDFGYKPNLDAAKFVIDEIVKKDVSNDNLYYLVGRNPSSYMIKMSKLYPEKLIVTNEVENPLNYIANLDIYISPLFIGTGMKNKILNAMAMGIPIICTEISAEGISELEDGENFDLCNSYNGKDWLKLIYNLKNSFEKRNNYSLRIKKIINNNYNWYNISNEFLEKVELI